MERNPKDLELLRRIKKTMMLIRNPRNQPSTSSSASAAASSNPPSRPSRQNTTATKWSAGNVTLLSPLTFHLPSIHPSIHPSSPQHQHQHQRITNTYQSHHRLRPPPTPSDKLYVSRFPLLMNLLIRFLQVLNLIGESTYTTYYIYITDV